MSLNEITVNTLPIRTWNWLKMNESQVQVGEIGDASKFKIEIPKGIHQAETDLSDFATGLGKEHVDLMRNIKPLCYETEAGTKVDSALRFCACLEEDKAALTVHYHALAESESVLVFDVRSEKEATTNLLTRIQVDQGAKVTLVQVHRQSDQAVVLNNVGARVEEGGKFEVIHIFFGAKNIYSGCSVDLLGENSKVNINIGYLVDKDHRLDMNYIANHYGVKSVSNMYASGVLRNQGSKIFRGTIDFKRGSMQSKGDENEDVLLMDDGVRNQSVPVILCAEDDVEGNHGATIGKLDPDMIFYLMTRGMALEDIYELVAKARIATCCERIPDKQMRDDLEDFLENNRTSR